MKYKFFYSDFCEGKEILSSDAWDVELKDILHSMDCVLHMPDNFLGIVNDKNQTLQFMVKKDKTILIDIPILKNGEYSGSKQKDTALPECLELVKSLKGGEDFHALLSNKPWWKFW